MQIALLIYKRLPNEVWPCKDLWIFHRFLLESFQWFSRQMLANDHEQTIKKCNIIPVIMVLIMCFTYLNCYTFEIFNFIKGYLIKLILFLCTKKSRNLSSSEQTINIFQDEPMTNKLGRFNVNNCFLIVKTSVSNLL